MITTVNLRGTERSESQRTSLIDQLARKADVNKDGTVSSAEFTAFLSRLTDTLDGEARAAKTADRSLADQSATPAPAAPVTTDGPAGVAHALRRAIRRTNVEGE